MKFRRRSPLSLPARLRSALAPPRGWGRVLRYHAARLRRLPDPPHRVARGVACGVFASFTPLFGLHFFLSAGLAWLVRGNVAAALIATLFGNPVTFPLIAWSSVWLGQRLLGLEADPSMTGLGAVINLATSELWSNLAALFTGDETRWPATRHFFDAIFLPYLLGGLGPGLICALAADRLTLAMLRAYVGRSGRKRQERGER